jgi:hypothetical protein
MNKPIILISVLVVLTTLFLMTAVAYAQESLVQLRVVNKTDRTVTILLFGPEGLAAYALNTAPGTTEIFTVERGTYNHTTFSCGLTASGTVDLSSQLRLTFTPCLGAAPNSGAPTLEKVHLDDAPIGAAFRFQYR